MTMMVAIGDDKNVVSVQDWVRLRLRQAGLPKATAIHLVSSSKGAGVRDLVRSLHKSVGLRYDVWVVSLLGHCCST